ncbi:MAG TPA: prolipoprotein diacylglyceryl transferase family protein, partial [Candidatus Binatia bacterium]|nr:prolipoprotein diacylglyceryl transferase family protein [Candidatus Binatia bacterium]
HRLPLGKLFDAGAPGLAVGAAIARIGCFCAGCCYGRPTDSVLGVHFPYGHLGMAQLAAGDPRGLHPTQLYLAASALAIAAILLALGRRGRRRPGDLFLLGTALYAASAFAIEFLRDDPGRWFGGGLSHSQWISLAILVVLGTVALRRAAAPRYALATATALLVALATASRAAAQAEPPLAPDTLMEIVGRGLVDGRADALLVLGRFLEFGGGGPLETWSRIGLGTRDLFDGNLSGALAEWRRAAADAGDTPWGAHAQLAVGFGEVMSGRPDAAVPAFRAAVEAGDRQTVGYAALSLGRVLAAQGDPAGAEASLRRVLAEQPRASVADDAALALARVLVGEGRTAEARAVLADARRYERDGSYKQAGRDRALRWDRLALLGEARLGRLLRERAARAAEHEIPVLDALLGALTDRWAAPELRRLRVRVDRLVAGDAAGLARPAAAAPATSAANPAGPGTPASLTRETIAARAARFYAARALLAGLALAVVALGLRAMRAHRRPPARAPARWPLVAR